MGLEIQKYELLGGLAQIKDVYVKIRKLTTDKDEITGEFLLRFAVYYLKDNIYIEKTTVSITSTEPFVNVWEDGYKYLKKQLKEQKIRFKDV